MAKKTKEKGRNWIKIVVFFLVFGFLDELEILGFEIEGLTQFILSGLICWGGFRAVNQIQLLGQSRKTQRIEALKSEIQQAEYRIQKLKQYDKQTDMTAYVDTAQQLLPQLTHIQKEADDLQKQIGTRVYQRISKKIRETRTSVQSQLNQIETERQLSLGQLSPNLLKQQAPELLTVYHNVQRDHQMILEKIQTNQRGNEAELRAIHEANMQRFEDIITGYLKIKASPKDFYHADQRMAQAKAALEQFDKDLDDTLKELNESELQDFEVSLRLMQQKTQDNTENTNQPDSSLF